jgi:hypothetical protein
LYGGYFGVVAKAGLDAITSAVAPAIATAIAFFIVLRRLLVAGHVRR